MSEITRHFTATTFVVCDGKVLLHLHAKQQLCLPPGGHIERDELPDDAARREIEEETGLQLKLHSEGEAELMSAEMACRVVAQPAFVLVEDINPFHQHIDFIYFADASGGLPPAAVPATRSAAGPQPDVHEGFRWFGPEQLEVEGVPQNVKEGARRALAYFTKSSS
jgi:8-oxo-dGTP pyrophosphatase MutT (NUDIX family)